MAAFTAPRFAHTRRRFVLFGDSITQQGFSVGGWGGRLQDRYARFADVENRGFSGYNSEWARLLLPSLFPPDRGRACGGGLRGPGRSPPASFPLKSGHTRMGERSGAVAEPGLAAPPSRGGARTGCGASAPLALGGFLYI